MNTALDDSSATSSWMAVIARGQLIGDVRQLILDIVPQQVDLTLKSRCSCMLLQKCQRDSLGLGKLTGGSRVELIAAR